MQHGTDRDCSATGLFPGSASKHRGAVAELSSSPLLSWRPPLVLEEDPKLNTRAAASGVVTLSITQSWIFVSDPCILCGWFGGGSDSPDL